ncbi:MAG: hypothetical protein GY726_05220, partial [Proteobacteria bacterium]|nr:hypothetical protein [Pseudomonadota bacterium]
YQEGEFRRAFDAWSLDSYEGNAEAQYNLGVLYLEGQGVERNVKQARAWFLKAAEKDQLEAQHNLGHMSLSGKGVKKNVQDALLWWKRAAEGGYAQAQFDYGHALYLGIDGYSYKEDGLSFIRLAAEQKDKRAQEFLDDHADEIAHLQPVENEAAEKAELFRADGPTPKADPAPASLPDSEPGEVKLKIVRDKRPVQQGYIMRSAEVPVTIYTHTDFQTTMGQLQPGTLLKVAKIEENKIQVIPAVGLPVWVERSHVNLLSLSPGVKKANTRVYAQPGGDQIGVLPAGVRFTVLEQNKHWVKLRRLIPVYGWIEANDLMYSGETSQQLRKAWQAELQTTNNPESEPRIEVSTPDVEKQPTPEPQQIIASKEIEKAGELETATAPQTIAASRETKIDLNTTINDNAWLFTQDKGAYVIHLFSLLDFDKALAISRELSSRGMAHLYTTQVNQQSWTFLLLGPYANKKAATSALHALPDHYAKGARTRLISLIAEKRCAKRNQLDAQQAKELGAYCF